jgi:hypothetical protein
MKKSAFKEEYITNKLGVEKSNHSKTGDWPVATGVANLLYLLLSDLPKSAKYVAQSQDTKRSNS